ncbi:MAG: hypothetical protein P4L66_16010 [Acetobacteraceae bacterium]|nr:hypothetical protein [Acetobacteraceae bacterium]
MTIVDVVNDIRRGCQRGPEAEEAERGGEKLDDPDDALQLSFEMAIAIQLGGGTRYNLPEALDLAGRILCPLFDYAKPTQYRTEMRKIRLQYRGIARNFELQRDWFTLTELLVKKGALTSVDSAVKAQIWSELGRKVG